MSFASRFGYSAVYIYVDFLLGLVASVLIARGLGAENYGVYSYFIRMSAVLIIIINGGLATGVLRFVSEYSNSDNYGRAYERPIFEYFKRQQIFKCVVILLVFYFVLHRAAGLITDSLYDSVLLIFVAAVAFKSFHMFQVGMLKGMERFDRLALVVMVVSPIYLLLAIAGYVTQQGLAYYAGLYLVVSLLLWLGAAFVLRGLVNRDTRELPDGFKPRANAYVRVLAANTVLSTLVLGYIEIYYLKLFASLEAIGLFNIGLMISTAAVAMVPGVYNSILMPMIVRNATQNEERGDGVSDGVMVYGAMRHMLILSLLVTLPAACFSYQLIFYLYGEAFIDSAMPLMYMLVASNLTSIVHPIIAYLSSKDRQSEFLKINVVVILFSLICGYFLISNYGIPGAVFSYSLSMLLSAILFLLLIVKTLSLGIEGERIARVIMAASVSVVVLYVLVESFTFSGLAEMIVGSMFYAILFASLIFLFGGVSRDERGACLSLFESMFSSRSRL